MALNETEIDAAARGEKTTAATAVYRQLRQDILKGNFKPGQKLQIDQVATRYGSGTNPVREALNRLSSEHLVDRHDQRGFFVPPLSMERLRELVKTRCWLESIALEESIANRTPGWEDGIVLTFHHLSRTPIRTPEEGGDNSEWEVRHRAFHNALISGCGSTWLIGFCNEMMDHAERYRYISMSTYPRRDSVVEHRLIMEAALDGDVELAKTRLTDQYRLTLRHLEEQVAAAGG
ncbi:GntR family transcriptional regulator [Neoaquamicrobium sediminum]|uniref:GntR family transcriptional regulator n=1 Tax=Neoaquamicrobium sediminum TaxID=1849104 RepID=UPI003BADBD4A